MMISAAIITPIDLIKSPRIWMKAALMFTCDLNLVFLSLSKLVAFIDCAFVIKVSLERRGPRCCWFYPFCSEISRSGWEVKAYISTSLSVSLSGTSFSPSISWYSEYPLRLPSIPECKSFAIMMLINSPMLAVISIIVISISGGSSTL